MSFLLNSVPDAQNRFVPQRRRTISVHGDGAARPLRDIVARTLPLIILKLF
ncbi:hypothetical protein [Paraburkholderia tropica]|uniref:hypothetical protein n=1 Tax=Paraburkholderia tropica TaxID=92647 RepID=UPI002AB72BAF|nr:hypothetical protein [Paraburkholderia tropica]